MSMGKIPPGNVQGLTEYEAQRRLSEEGFNELPKSSRTSVFTIVLEVVREPMFALLLGSAVLYAFLGDLNESLILLLFACISSSIAITQRARSERVLESLRDLSSPRALVIRAGKSLRIPGRNVCRGDVIVINEGDRVPADANLIAGHDLSIDESLLTGESVPVSKGVEQPLAATETSGTATRVFSGTLVLSGDGIAIVSATGPHTEVGKIGRAVQSIKQVQPRLQRQIRRLVKVFAVFGFAACTCAVLLHGVLRGDWVQSILGGLALGMSMLPEEFPLVLTVFMVMGAFRLSRSRVLTRNAQAIEALGTATVLCTDKTGTLTINQMRVVELATAHAGWAEVQTPEIIAGSEELRDLLEAAMHACGERALDPMDQAIIGLASDVGIRPLPEKLRAQVFPLTRDLLAVTHVWRNADDTCTVATKGAPEALARLCKLNESALADLTLKVNLLAGKGMRVLGVGRGVWRQPDLPTEPAAFDLALVGLVALADPLRDNAMSAISECRTAGIRVVMITGDYPETARAIARQAGIGDGKIMTGVELDSLDEAALSAQVAEVTVFARTSPSNKHRIVHALQSRGEIVAMTGDGVNDAPALKAADIGIAMGGRGTDVAREASSLVLLDDDFNSIVAAIRLGRRIFDNLSKATGYILAVHLPIAGLALLPLLLGWPILLTPMLIALLELIIDPACSMVLEAEHSEKDIMTRPPRNPEESLISPARLIWGLVAGGLSLVAVGSVYIGATMQGLPTEEVRSLTFLSLVGANLALIFTSRTFRPAILDAIGRPNAVLGWGLAALGLIMTTLMASSMARGFFQLAPANITTIAVAVGTFVVLLVALQSVKRLPALRVTGSRQLT